MPYYQDSLIIDGMQRASGTYTWQDSEWSKGSFMLDMMAWDSGNEGFLRDRTVQRSGTIEWRISNLGIFSSDSGDQALLEDKPFLAGRTVISPILIFYLTRLTEFIGEVLSIAQFCNVGIRDIFGTWDLEKPKISTLVECGATPQRICTPWRKNQFSGKEVKIFG